MNTLERATEALERAVSLLRSMKQERAPRRACPSHTEFWAERLKHTDRALIKSASGLTLAVVMFKSPPARVAESNTLIAHPEQSTPVLNSGIATRVVFVDFDGEELLNERVNDGWGRTGLTLANAHLCAGARLEWHTPFRFTGDVE